MDRIIDSTYYIHTVRGNSGQHECSFWTPHMCARNQFSVSHSSAVFLTFCFFLVQQFEMVNLVTYWLGSHWIVVTLHHQAPPEEMEKNIILSQSTYLILFVLCILQIDNKFVCVCVCVWSPWEGRKNGNICTCTELLLRSTAQGTSAVFTDVPIVASYIPPLSEVSYTVEKRCSDYIIYLIHDDSRKGEEFL